MRPPLSSAILLRARLPIRCTLGTRRGSSQLSTLHHIDCSWLSTQIVAWPFESLALGGQPVARGINMSQKRDDTDSDMLPEYDFTGAVRGKYYQRYLEGTNVVLLDPDVAVAFPSSAAVNDALRLLVSIADAKVTRRPPQVDEQQPSNRDVSRAQKDLRPKAKRR